MLITRDMHKASLPKIKMSQTKFFAVPNGKTPGSTAITNIYQYKCHFRKIARTSSLRRGQGKIRGHNYHLTDSPATWRQVGGITCSPSIHFAAIQILFRCCDYTV